MAFQVRIGTTSDIATNGSGVEGNTMVTIPISSTYKTTSTTVVDSSRNTEGKALFSIVRPNVRKIELTFRVISSADYSKIAKFLNDNFVCYAYYFDQDDNAWETREVYCNDRTADALKNEQWTQNTGVGGGIAPKHVENFRLALIEV